MDLLNDPQLWRERASQARANAARIDDFKARHSMLIVADEYERIAARAEERLRATLIGTTVWGQPRTG
jgi:hypothetical protein